MPMRKFYVIWTYLANYGVMDNVEAETAELAARRGVLGFSEDFARKGKVYVFDDEPLFVYHRGDSK